MQLTEQYRPKALQDILGNPWIVQQLEAYVETPYSAAFLFAGETGTGKTSAALALGSALGILVEEAEFGGFYQIASGEQTGESVRRVMDLMRCRPFFGSGWRMLVVNEADAMTANAAHVWLDALENLPQQAVVVFTSNRGDKLPRRLRDRCETMFFEASGLFLRSALEELARKVWSAEVGGDCPELETFGTLIDEEGNLSFRRLLQLMAPHIRTAKAGLAAAAPPRPEAKPVRKRASRAAAKAPRAKKKPGKRAK